MEADRRAKNEENLGSIKSACSRGRSRGGENVGALGEEDADSGGRLGVTGNRLKDPRGKWLVDR